MNLTVLINSNLLLQIKLLVFCYYVHGFHVSITDKKSATYKNIYVYINLYNLQRVLGSALSKEVM